MTECSVCGEPGPYPIVVSDKQITPTGVATVVDVEHRCADHLPVD